MLLARIKYFSLKKARLPCTRSARPCTSRTRFYLALEALVVTGLNIQVFVSVSTSIPGYASLIYLVIVPVYTPTCRSRRSQRYSTSRS